MVTKGRSYLFRPDLIRGLFKYVCLLLRPRLIEKKYKTILYLLIHFCSIVFFIPSENIAKQYFLMLLGGSKRNIGLLNGFLSYSEVHTWKKILSCSYTFLELMLFVSLFWKMLWIYCILFFLKLKSLRKLFHLSCFPSFLKVFKERIYCEIFLSEYFNLTLISLCIFTLNSN